MALITCAECGREISDQAPACPGCGAPPEVFARTGVHDDPSVDSAAVATAFLHAATSGDGRPLWYNTDVRAFYLAEVPISVGDVRRLDGWGDLTWTRFDVRGVMRKAAKTGLPMGDLPVPKEHPMLQRTAAFLQSAGEGARRQSAALVCPHCQSEGTVRTKQVMQKRGISGGKATAAVLTGGISLLATGLSRKEPCTEAHCSHCGSTWRF